MRAGERLREQLAQLALVRRVGVGVQQRDRHRLRCRLRHALDNRLRVRGLQRAQRALGPHPLGHPEAQLGFDQRRGRSHAQTVELRAALSAEGDHVGEALSSQQRGSRRAPLEQRVGRHGHPMGEALDGIRLRVACASTARTASSTAID